MNKIINYMNKLNTLLKLQNKPIFKLLNVNDYNYNFLIDLNSVIYDYDNFSNTNIIYYNNIYNKQNLYIKSIYEIKSINIINYLKYINVDFTFEKNNILYVYDENINFLKIINYILKSINII